MDNSKVVFAVVLFLGVTILLCVIGGFLLVLNDKEVPEFLVGLGGTALGALGALLSRVGDPNKPQQVYVTNEKRDAVPVEQTS